jgi:pyridoxal phosphate enzyme (YggS family)
LGDIVDATDEAAVARRLARLREQLTHGARRGPVTLCAVTKGFGADAVTTAHRLGCDAVGENYAQEAVAKIAAAGPQHPPVHFIGRLQTNKIRSLVDVVDVWQSVDRDSVVDELAKRAPGAQVYVQVNATGEPDKGGCPLSETPRLVERARASGLQVAGLMTVGPTDGDPVVTRAAFAAVRRAADDLGLAGCSMGMSGDLEIALEEGTTMVRVGTALFGERP